MREILLYDEIGPGYYGLLDGAWMAEQLRTAGPEPVRVRINSPGGSVFEGQAMYSLLRNHTPGVTITIDALAASAASFVAMAGDRIEIAENAMVMVHSASALEWGNAVAHEKIADLLTKVDEQLVAQYAARTKADPQQIRDWMAAETWMTAAEAVERGFADVIGTKNNAKACVRPGAFAKTPEHMLAARQTLPAANAAAAIRRRLAMAHAVG